MKYFEVNWNHFAKMKDSNFGISVRESDMPNMVA